MSCETEIRLRKEYESLGQRLKKFTEQKKLLSAAYIEKYMDTAMNKYSAHVQHCKICKEDRNES